MSKYESVAVFSVKEGEEAARDVEHVISDEELFTMWSAFFM